MIPLLSIAYLPPVPYIAACMQSEKILLEKHEHYSKQTFRNRALIASANGILPLIIPVQHERLYAVPISEVKIDYSTNWQKVHWKSIVSAYRKSAFFEYYEDELAPFYEEKTTCLFHFNFGLLRCIFRLMGMEITIGFTEEYFRNPPDTIDLRASFQSGAALTASLKIPENRYRQVFSERHGFLPGLSVLDLLFNSGPESAGYLHPEYR